MNPDREIAVHHLERAQKELDHSGYGHTPTAAKIAGMITEIMFTDYEESCNDDEPDDWDTRALRAS